MANTMSIEVCQRCKQETDSLSIFPGGLCLKCWDRIHGNDPLTEQGLRELTNTFLGKSR